MRNRIALAVGSSLAVLASCAGSAQDPAAATPAGAVQAAAPPPVDSATALPPGGGCHPVGAAASGLDLFPLVNPEWAPVEGGASPFSAPVVVHGTVMDSHVSREDFPSTHVTFDQNTSIAPDPEDRGLVATGNAREAGELELEWESGSYPAWAWGSPGDRIVAAGRWIFDCGHPDPEPGACADAGAKACVLDTDCQGVACAGTRWNYRSELHPPHAVAVIRPSRPVLLAPPGREPPEWAALPALLASDVPAVPLTRADVYVSADGGAAGDLCVVSSKGDFDAFIGAPCFPLAAPLALMPQDAPSLNAADFAFDVPLPPRTGGDAFVRVVPRDLPDGALPARLELEQVLDDPAPHVRATVRLTEPDASGRLPTAFAGSILAGWRAAARRPYAHVRVTLDGVKVLDPLKAAPFLGGPVADGWVMEAAVEGEWQQLRGLDGVTAASAGAVVPLHAAFDALVPSGGTIALLASAASRSCNDLLFGRRLLDDVVAFGGDTTKALLCMSDRRQRDAGTVSVDVPVPRRALRPDRYLVHAEGGGAAYALAFRVERVPDR